MTKLEYLDVLKDYLKKYYSEEETLEILRDYEEYFLNGKLDGKTEGEIVLELGSPKSIVKELIGEEIKEEKTGFFSKYINKFDNWFENKASKSSTKEEKIENNSLANFIRILVESSSFLTVLILAFVSIFFMLIGMVRLSFFAEVVGFTIFILTILKYGKSKTMISTAKSIIIFSIVFYLIFFILSINIYGSRGIVKFSFVIKFILYLLDIIYLAITEATMISLVILSGIFIFCILPVFGFLLFLIGLTIAGVVTAVFLTPVVYTGLAYLGLSQILLIYPILLAIGLLILMTIIIKYFSLFLYKLILKYYNWIKIKMLYSSTYNNRADDFEKMEVENEK